MNNREAHYYLEELQRMMAQHRGIFSEEFVCANGMAIQALEQERKTGKWTIEDCHVATYKYCCSACGAHHRARYDFCPSCGAKMKGETE